ncbi:MAG: hypothetical protein A2653_00470 [Candidatus Zambryskibacteria bacterium RIFCSPHIGHO2_01_FULL_43_25]|uniref:Phosphatidic acid phosphatase type 2/haloperoxidase domain-containing protein n=1 Tax=Candidatus Zambryskibacteria bacterium RIFCSPLOWO2_01_FULL_45_21 TaxID=1802761 RepID=A0A1G2U1Q7_9BACT|nr:MAG: hypothetical protein A2653_00470 [Candidatus Zambryskibacteria bacterium RIFCSPHIGHO2_01_FULL_43_25]OHB00883.1 MAG: hypothetical protein A3E94_01355 [Candidatus Zambryskibacteria bacterium RIFCSPHIGHO2_12_FULL_44_12b]OHB03339.1 MAG: hypothetical protein A3B14_00305 [Candidatus Zambryskibacteria bacterium RIFCSPLOWO2_01_FULL_45_21]
MSDSRIKWSFGLLAAISLAVFCLIVAAVSRGQLVPLDLLLYENAPNFQIPLATYIMGAVSGTLHPGVLLFLAVLVSLFFLIRREPQYAVIFFFSTALALVSAVFVKEFLSIDRPMGIVGETGFSFPSLHTTIAAVFFVSSMYALAEHMKEGLVEVLVAVLGVVLIILTALSRLYLQVHWLSDTVGGIALGVFWASVLIAIFHMQVRKML